MAKKPIADDPLLIVGIGASAGGLQALQVLFRNLPADTGMAFIVVTHQARGQESALPSILARFTSMAVIAAVSDLEVEPNHVYVCPPDSVLTLKGRRLQAERPKRQLQLFLIDAFLISLAEQAGESAIGILLSGGGTDGTLGIKAIKDRGGLTLAQGHDGTAPLQSSMPDTAISVGVVDLVMSVENMGPRLAEYARQFTPAVDDAADEAASSKPEPRRGYEAIFQILLNQVGHDFSGYKQRTFQRRVERRMQVVQLTALDQYIARLRESPDEVTLLFRDLLIGVTSFFRDPPAFEALEKLVIPRLFDRKGANDSIRVWVPGCASGEEAYSIAILLREQLDSIPTPPKIQLFATDIDEGALALARIGHYAAPLLDRVSPERLKRFFVADDVGFVVSKELREMCVFSAHNLLRDPPFSKLDLISCRNVLIYFGIGLQSQAIPIFHFALKPGAFLFLGTSENVSHHTDLFSPVDKKQRIFQRRDHVAIAPYFPKFATSGRSSNTTAQLDPAAIQANLRRSIDARVLEQFAPAHVVVNGDGDILHYSARTGKYLEPAAGLPNRLLLAMARKGLRLELRSALREAMDARRPVRRPRVAIDSEHSNELVEIAVDPIGDTEHDPVFLVVFRDVSPPPEPVEPQAGSPANDVPTERLEHELREMRERLQLTVEEYETAVEELKSSNEELQSINEELQSTNEELETSKEEMQSVNEELQTVNAELSDKIEQVDGARNDLRNVFEGTQVATVFLDKNLVIRSFTPAITSIFNLISTDRGRPLTDIANSLEGIGDLQRDIRTVFEHGETIERRLRRNDKRTHYLMRILPYRTENDVIEGALVTFVDVTNLVEAEARQRVLLQELNQGTSNILDVVTAITDQTLAAARPPDELTKTYQGRVKSLAASYTLLAREQWSGVQLQDIIASQVALLPDSMQNRVAIQGPPVSLKPAATLALGAVFHELANNAAHHGALSKATGRVAVTWRTNVTERGVLTINWRESDGPLAKKPGANGFGISLIQREIAALDGSADFDFNRAGLTVQISFSLVASHFGENPAPASDR
jgi:two-component system, chemotaxis family, CheB/CheR fusion protein